MNFKLFSFFFLLLFVVPNGIAQDPLRFEDEVSKLMSMNDVPGGEKVYLFTGSSSIKFWKTLSTDFPNDPVLNRGFGGSQMSDLLYYRDSLIFKYSPDKVFIYEGDNDIALGKTTLEIMSDTKLLARHIRERLPDTDIYFIAAKPSVARWAFQKEYVAFNQALSLWCGTDEKITFIDIWQPMCNEDGTVKSHIFSGDNLHMNAQGYAIWAEVMRPYISD